MMQGKNTKKMQCMKFLDQNNECMQECYECQDEHQEHYEDHDEHQEHILKNFWCKENMQDNKLRNF